MILYSLNYNNPYKLTAINSIMSKIQILSEEIINKIAAGEVIERPASVVKELLENSLDAGATNIIVELKNYGQDLIKISDNGCGMSREDAERSILRHTTSKLKSAEDLFSIKTLGFRGEALASIAAVSKLVITTKPANQLEACKLAVTGGTITELGIAASETGTTVEVKDLFFNTPARKKFLKTNAVELRQVINVISHYALLHHKIGFKLIHDYRELINSPATAEIRNSIAAIYGLDIAREMIPAQYNDNQVSLSGMVIKPYFARNDKQWQTLLVNERWVRNEDLTNAVYEAYHSILFVNKHPVFVLNLQLDPATIDVNVHPTKLDIKIEQKELVCSAVTKAVREALARHNLLPEIDVSMEEVSMEEYSLPPVKKISLPPKYSFDHSQQAILRTALKENTANYDHNPSADNLLADNSSADNLLADNLLADNSSAEPLIIPEQQFAPELTAHSTLPPLKLLGQIHKTFFAAETVGGMFFIDQHAAHERALYGRFMEQYSQGNVGVQQLLRPEILEVALSSEEVIKENIQLLEKLGFAISEFGNHSFVIKTIPAIFGRLQAKEMIYEIIEKWGKQNLELVKEEIIIRMACRSAVMAGEELTIAEMNNLLRELSATQLPFTCPHGRPTMIKVSVEELEKKFRRKG